MIGRIAQKEFVEIVRDGRCRLIGAAVFVLLTFAFLVGWNHLVAVSREREIAQEASSRQWLEQGEKNPHSAAHHAIFAFKTVPPFALADTGIDPFTGVAVWLEAHKQNELSYSAAGDTTAAARFGQLTAATVLQVLIPLIIIMLSFGALAGERETGTLRLILSLGVRRSDLVVGKILGVACALGVLLLPATMIGSAAVFLSSETLDNAATVPRFFLLVLVYFIFFAVVLAISFTVSAFAPSSRFALILLLGFWTANLIVPRITTDAARLIYPTPSALEFQSAIASR